ncbi:MAG: PKD domain-containing protein, partial [Sediminicola sp.]
GCPATIHLEVLIDNTTDGCPNFLKNENANMVLKEGTKNTGLDTAIGTPFNTNGSPCAFEISNTDPGQPWANYRITLNLNQLGILPGHELYFSLDAYGTNGVPRLEVNRNNTPNSGILTHTFGSGWNTFSGTITVPAGTTTLDLWLFSNYNRQTPGTVAYDNLVITNLSASGANRPPVAVASATPLSGASPLEVGFTGSESTDDAPITQYAWEFGDGQTSAQADPTHTYTAIGSYTALLTVTDDQGLSDSSSLTINVTDGSACPDALANDGGDIMPGNGSLGGGMDSAMGTSTLTNGSPCALILANNDSAQPWARYSVPIDLAANGVAAGDQIFISLDAEGTNGVPRMEVNRNNTPNSGILTHTFGSGWNTFSGTITVPAGTTTLDLWLFSNYNRQTPGTVTYDNLVISKVSPSLSAKSIGEIKEMDALSVHPNPASTQMSIGFKGKTVINTVMVFDMNGRLVQSLSPHNISVGEEHLLDISGLPVGSYYLKILDKEGKQYQKQIIVKR